jgi:hypothetical protein
MGVSASHHSISGVDGLDDPRRGAFQGFSFETRYRLLDRQSSGVGLSILAEPHWMRVDELSGQPVDQYGSDLAILIDKELVPDRIVAVFNLLYEAEVTRSCVTGVWSRDSTAGAGAGLMARVGPDMFVGGEARYLRAYDNLGLREFAGQAVFIGPNVFFSPADRWRVTAHGPFRSQAAPPANPGRWI